MNNSEQWVASGATQGFEALCARWENARATAWDSLPETGDNLLKMLMASDDVGNPYPFGRYFYHYFAYRFSPWVEALASKHGIPIADEWENEFAELLFSTACKKEKKLIKEVAAISGMPKQILVNGLDKMEATATAIFHLATYGTPGSTDRPSAAALRLMGFAAAIQMFPGDVELFLKKAMKVPDYDLWEKRQFLYFLTFRYARGKFPAFYAQLLALYEQAPIKNMDSFCQGRADQLNTESLEFLILKDVSIQNHSIDSPSPLAEVLARHKWLMQCAGAHVSIRASAAKEILKNIDASFRDITYALEAEEAVVSVEFQSSTGLSIAAGTILHAELLELSTSDSYMDKDPVETFLLPVSVLETVDIAPDSCSGATTVADITVAVDPTFFGRYKLVKWHWMPIHGVLQVGSGEGKLRHAKHMTLSDYLYGANFPKRSVSAELSDAVFQMLDGKDFSETELAKLRNPEQYIGDIKINRTTILTLAAIETMMELRATGRPVAGDDYEDEQVSPQDRVFENHQMFWQNVNDWLHMCHYFGIYLLDPYDRLLASIMACESPIDFYRFLWSCKKTNMR